MRSQEELEGLMIIYCCIAPHGGEVIPEIARRIDRRRFEPTRAAMRQLAKKIRAARPDTIVLATPHNLRLFEKIGIVTAENSSGRLGGAGREVSGILDRVEMIPRVYSYQVPTYYRMICADFSPTPSCRSTSGASSSGSYDSKAGLIPPARMF